MLHILKISVTASLLLAVVILTIQIIKTFSFGKRSFYASPRGNSTKGIIYAFGQGMTPWEKESAGKHLSTYLAGVLYHLGVFSSLLYLFLLIIAYTLPPIIINILRLLLFIGFLCGFALLVKRLSSSKMRAISCPDDYASNIIVNLFLALTLVHTYTSSITSYYYITAIVLFLYVPVGKIRHCFFFFYVRILFGIFYGRRNVLPPRKKIEFGK